MKIQCFDSISEQIEKERISEENNRKLNSFLLASTMITVIEPSIAALNCMVFGNSALHAGSTAPQQTGQTDETYSSNASPNALNCRFFKHQCASFGGKGKNVKRQTWLLAPGQPYWAAPHWRVRPEWGDEDI